MVVKEPKVAAILVVATLCILSALILGYASLAVPSHTIPSTGHMQLQSATTSVFSTPQGPLQVEYVEARQFVCDKCGAVNGTSYVTFIVGLRNAGDQTVTVMTTSGGISGSIPTNSTVLAKVQAKEFCTGTVGLVQVKPGENLTLTGPTECTGFYYQVVSAGNASVNFSFSWKSNSSSPYQNTTMIFATLRFWR